MLMYLWRSSVKVRTLSIDVGSLFPVLLVRDGHCWASSSRTLSYCCSDFGFFCSSCLGGENIEMIKAKRGARVKVRTPLPLVVDIIYCLCFARWCWGDFSVEAFVGFLLCTCLFAVVLESR